MKTEEIELLENNDPSDGLASFYSDEEEELNSNHSYQLNKQPIETSDTNNQLLPPPVTQPLRYQPQNKLLRLLLPILILLSLWGSTLSNIFLTKTLFTRVDFPFPNPIFLTWCQQVFLFLFLLVSGELGKTRPTIGTRIPPFELDGELLKKVAPLSLVYLVMVLISNLSLFYTEVTYYQVASGLSVIFTLLLEKVMLNKTATPSYLVTGLIITVGFVMASLGYTGYNLVGVGSGIALGFSLALNTIYTKKTLTQINNEWVILTYNAAISIVLTLPIILVSGELVRVAYTPSIALPSFWFTTLILSILLFFTQVTTAYQPVFVSSLVVTILSITKETIQAILGAVIFKINVSTLYGLGITLVIIGLGCFIYLRHSDCSRLR